MLGLIVDLPFLSRPVCLPVAARLHRPKGEQTKVEPAASMIRFLAACHWGRRIDAVADAAYHGRALRDLPVSVTFTTRVPSSAVLYALAPPPTGRRGRPRLKGDRLGTPAEPAATLMFTPQAVTRYGRTETVFTTETTCLWYGSFHTQTVKVLLLREDVTDTGYDLALISTDLTASAGQPVARYVARWSIEVTFGEARGKRLAGPLLVVRGGGVWPTIAASCRAEVTVRPPVGTAQPSTARTEAVSRRVAGGPDPVR